MLLNSHTYTHRVYFNYSCDVIIYRIGGCAPAMYDIIIDLQARLWCVLIGSLLWQLGLAFITN